MFIFGFGYQLFNCQQVCLFFGSIIFKFHAINIVKMSDHYKLLISDEEVIKALLKDSKRREGKLPTEVTRIKPNLNFFQRTVNSLVSNNTRIDKSVDTFKSQHIKERTEADFRISPTHRKVRPKINYNEERKLVLDNKIKFVKSAERLSIKNVDFSGTDVPMKTVTMRTEKSRQPFNSAVLQHESSNATKDSDLFDSKNSLTCSVSNFKAKNNVKLDYFDNSEVIYISSDDDSIEIITSFPPKSKAIEVKGSSKKVKFKKKIKKLK